MNEILELTEFETKYKVGDSIFFPFKRLMEDQEEKSEFIYVESDDQYYAKDPIKQAVDFFRLRYSNHKNVKQKFLTYKKKLQENSNIQRLEIDLRIDPTENYENRVTTLCEALGYKKAFKITKLCHIYKYSDAVLVFYTVIDGKNIDHFIEIEVNEHLEFTESQAWDIIKKWEKILEPLGITAKNRTRLSLFEMYRR